MPQRAAILDSADKLRKFARREIGYHASGRPDKSLLAILLLELQQLEIAHVAAVNDQRLTGDKAGRL